MIVYLEDTGGDGVQVSVEMVGRPTRSVILTNALIKDLLKIDWVCMADRSIFTEDPITDTLQ